MSHARPARRVLAAMACTAVVASAGCRSPFHSFADVAKPGAPEAVAAIDRKDVSEAAPAAAVASHPPRPADAPPATADEPTGPVETPMLDAALRRVEAAEEAQREAIREAQAPPRRPSVAAMPGPEPEPAVAAEPAPQPGPEPAVAAEPAPAPAAEPTAPTGIEIKATVAPPSEPAPSAAPEAGEPTAEASAEVPKSDPAVKPSSAEVEVAEGREQADADPTPALPAFATDDQAAAPPTPPAPTVDRESPPEAPAAVAEGPEPPPTDDSQDEAGTGLTIDAVRLCRKILDFGSYEPLKDRTLRPGRPALVYCELGGLEYRPEGDEFVAKVATRVELVRPADGAKVWEVSDSAVDRRPARRRDVYVGTMVTIPGTVAPGEYALRLHQADATSGREASAEIPVTIAR